MRLLVLSFALATSMLLACTLLVPIDGLVGGPVDASADVQLDATPAASLDAGGGDASDAAALDGGLTNLFPAGTFEAPTNDCGLNWALTAITVSRVAGGHDSPSACRVCSTTASTETAFDYYPVFTPGAVPGDTYQMRAWVRAVTGTLTFESRIRLWNGETFVQADSSGNVQIDTAWKEVVVTHTATAAAARVNPLFLSSPTAARECYLIDDIRLYELP